MNLSVHLFSLLSVGLFTALGFSGLSAQSELRITEIFFGQEGTKLTADWFEIRNDGSVAWTQGIDPDLYYDDESASASDADLIVGIQDLQPGEFAIVVIGNATDALNFRAVWEPVINLIGIEVGYTDGAGLSSNGDTVNIWVGNPLSGSLPVATEGYPAAQPEDDGRSFDILLNAFSTIGNDNGAAATIALGGNNSDVPNIASPGNQGQPNTDPNAPVISGDTMLSTSYLHIRPEASSIGADRRDPTDPAQTLGFAILVSDADDDPQLISVAASSSNQNVVQDSDILVQGTGATRSITITPTGVGYSTITLTATDPSGKSSTYTINYAASDATVDTATTRFHYGASDGSTAQPVGNDYMWVGDDEDQTLRLYNRHQSGMPIKTVDLSPFIGSGEIDIEGSFAAGNDTTYWMGSHTDLERSVIFRAILQGEGQDASLTYAGYYNSLRQDLLNWDLDNIHGLGAGFFNFAAGFEIEGFAADPQNPDGALLAFRGPLIDGDALILPVTNLQSIVQPTPNPNTAEFGTPIYLDLGGRSIRSIDCNDFGCLIVGGPAGTIVDFKLYTWTGTPIDLPELRAANLDLQAGLNSFEGIVALPDGPFSGENGTTKAVQFLVDTGTSDYYDDKSEAKDLPQNEWKKFRSEIVTIGEIIIPPVANPNDVVIHEIMADPEAVENVNGQWVELYNTSSGSIDLNGWTISLDNGVSHLITSVSPLVIPSEGYAVIGKNSDSGTNGGVEMVYAFDAFEIGSGNGQIILTAPDDLEIDRVEWSSALGFPAPVGASFALKSPNLDNLVGDNWCVASTPFGAGDFGTPNSANDCPAAPGFNLQITEIWPGQDGDDLTADWFEITNFGDQAWVSGVDSDLYYDDESQDPNVADLISGINAIQPGESAVVLVGQANSVAVFTSVWGPDYDLAGVEIGWTDGAGVGQDGDGITLFVGQPAAGTIVDYEAIPTAPSGLSYDVILGGFSQPGAGIIATGTNIATATTALNPANESAVGSPGNKGPLNLPQATLIISEIFSGQAGSDLTADWFEIRNTGNAPWISGVDPDLYYDDESQSPADADIIQGISEIPAGGTAIVLITGDPADIATFEAVWSPVIDLSGVPIGYTDGAGLGGGGDLVTLWLGNPAASAPIDTASYPDTELDDGKSWDVELMTFSEVGNANGAVATIALGGDQMDVPNIGSPGDGLAVVAVRNPENASPLVLFPNPTAGRVTISQNADFFAQRVEVFTLQGDPLLSVISDNPTEVQIDLSDLPSGTYILRATSRDNKIHTGAVIKF
jgi:hypothetical protein